MAQDVSQGVKRIENEFFKCSVCSAWLPKKDADFCKAHFVFHQLELNSLDSSIHKYCGGE